MQQKQIYLVNIKRLYIFNINLFLHATATKDLTYISINQYMYRVVVSIPFVVWTTEY